MDGLIATLVQVTLKPAKVYLLLLCILGAKSCFIFTAVTVVALAKMCNITIIIMVKVSFIA